MKKYQFITLTLIALTIVTAIPAEANERGLFNNQRSETRQEVTGVLKAKITERRKNIVEKKFQNIFNKFDRAILRLENAVTRIDSRILKIEEVTDKDLTSAKAKLEETKIKLTEVKNKIDSKQSEINSAISSGTEISFEEIRTLVKELTDGIREIRELLVETLKLIK